MLPRPSALLLIALSVVLCMCSASSPVFQARTLSQDTEPWPPDCRAQVDSAGWSLACPTVAGRLSRVAYPEPALVARPESAKVYWGKVQRSFLEKGWRAERLEVERKPWRRSVLPIKAWRVRHRGSVQDLYVSPVRMDDGTVRGFSCAISKDEDPERMGCTAVLAHLAKRASATKTVALLAAGREYTFEGCALGERQVLCRGAADKADLTWWEARNPRDLGAITFPERSTRQELERLGAHIDEVPVRCTVAGLEARCRAIRFQLPDTRPQLELWAYGARGERRFHLVCSIYGEVDKEEGLPAPCAPLIEASFTP